MIIKERIRVSKEQRERRVVLLLLSSFFLLLLLFFFFFSILPPLLTKYVSPLPLEYVPLLNVWRRSRKRRRRRKQMLTCVIVVWIPDEGTTMPIWILRRRLVGPKCCLEQTNEWMNEWWWMQWGNSCVLLLLPVWPIRQAQSKKSKHV